MAIGEDGEREIDRLAPDGRFVANLHPQRVEEHDGIHGLERPALPRRDFRHDAVGDGADQVRRDLDAVHLGEEALDFTHGHSARLQPRESCRRTL